MITDPIKAYLSELGKKGGATNKKKGSAYFKWVVSHRKNIKNKSAKGLVQIAELEEKIHTKGPKDLSKNLDDIYDF